MTIFLVGKSINDSNSRLNKRKRRESDIGVSFDGTWQRPGHSSLNGVGAAIPITTGKVLDCEVFIEIL